jgi:hypothetical protein
MTLEAKIELGMIREKFLVQVDPLYKVVPNSNINLIPEDGVKV